LLLEVVQLALQLLVFIEDTVEQRLLLLALVLGVFEALEDSAAATADDLLKAAGLLPLGFQFGLKRSR